MTDTLQAALEAAEREHDEAVKAQDEAAIAYRAATARVEVAYRGQHHAQRLLKVATIRERHPAGPASYEWLTYDRHGIPDRRGLATIESYTPTGRARVLRETWMSGGFRDRDVGRETLSLAETVELKAKIAQQQREGLPPLRKEQT